MSDSRPHVALFVTCLVDLIRPSIGFAAVKLLEDAGCRVSVPAAQTCCGQPAYNAGRRDDTTAIARQVIAAFDGFDHVVAPSGSCAGMIKVHYPDLFADDPAWSGRADDLAGRTHELTAFLGDVLGIDTIAARYQGVATYHDTCSGLRELSVKAQPRSLLAGVEGLTLTESEEAEICCGFGGTFCVKYPDISGQMVEAKADAVVATGADTLIGGDLGCLMNMAGRLSRRGHGIDVRHVAEVLVGDDETPPIGAA